MKDKVIKVGNKEVIQKFPVGHRNLDKLAEIIASCSERVLKEDCMDLPEKVYMPVLLEGSKPQMRLYNEMLDRALYLVDDSDIVVAAKNALDVLGKLSRISGGFAADGVPIDDNPKLKWVKANIDKYTETADVIIWCRYKDEMDLLYKELGAERCALINGDVTDDAREKEKQRFIHDKACKILVTNDTMSRGHTLINATTHIFYSNTYSLRDRRQMEDRSHRKGQVNKVLYIDLLLEDTVDVAIMSILATKKDVSQIIMSDPKTTWVDFAKGKKYT